jgi:(p)ppGpp synthase/HD superfamily hydrolase
MNDLILRSLKFATEAHKGQLRKYTNEPYIFHPIHVSNVVKLAGGSIEMVAASLLHDVVEDCESVSMCDILQFGVVVHRYVYFLTEPIKIVGINRKARKRIYNEQLGNSPVAVKTIKLADSIHNMECIYKYDKKFGVTYFEEKCDLLPYLDGGNEILFKKMKKMIQEAKF